MLFMMTWNIKAEHRDAALERFAKFGAQQPPGVKLVGRWHNLAERTGFALLEADDPMKMAVASLRWSDLLDSRTMTAITDEQLAKVVAESGLGKRG